MRGLEMAVAVEEIFVQSQARPCAFGGGNDRELNVPGDVACDIDILDAGAPFRVAGHAAVVGVSATQLFQERRAWMLAGIEEQRAPLQLVPVREVYGLKAAVVGCREFPDRGFDDRDAPVLE